MEIVTQKINQTDIILKFTQDLDNGVDDITPLINSLEQIKPIIEKVGFGNKF